MTPANPQPQPDAAELAWAEALHGDSDEWIAKYRALLASLATLREEREDLRKRVKDAAAKAYFSEVRLCGRILDAIDDAFDAARATPPQRTE